jgi:hypothetical protein
MSDRKQANLDRMNDLWHLHDPEDGSGTGRCLAFVLDRRYLDADEGAEIRLAVSFGDNVVSPETEQGFLPIPVRPGRLAFGVHEVGISGDKLTVFDAWLDTIEAGDVTEPAEAVVRAQAILDGMADARYFTLLSDPKDDQRTLKVSERFRLDEFEIVVPGTF